MGSIGSKVAGLVGDNRAEITLRGKWAEENERKSEM
jgi:hypothetical protein